jgi:REP element-mobilizing transposase RayT
MVVEQWYDCAAGDDAMNTGRPVPAYHVIWGAYGFWLPNDPRGSWSDFVRSWELFLAAGPATKVNTRRSVAHTAHDRAARLDAKGALHYPPVIFDGHQALSISHAFARMVDKSSYRVYACSILPEHVHMVLGRHRYKVETMVRLLKAEATTELMKDGRHPLAAYPLEDGTLPSPWAHRRWKVYLCSDEEILRAIAYVENNPVKEGKRPQRWPFVIPFIPTG